MPGLVTTLSDVTIPAFELGRRFRGSVTASCAADSDPSSGTSDRLHEPALSPSRFPAWRGHLHVPDGSRLLSALGPGACSSATGNGAGTPKDPHPCRSVVSQWVRTGRCRRACLPPGSGGSVPGWHRWSGRVATHAKFRQKLRCVATPPNVVCPPDRDTPRMRRPAPPLAPERHDQGRRDGSRDYGTPPAPPPPREHGHLRTHGASRSQMCSGLPRWTSAVTARESSGVRSWPFTRAAR